MDAGADSSAALGPKSGIPDHRPAPGAGDAREIAVSLVLGEGAGGGCSTKPSYRYASAIPNKIEK